MIPSIPSNPHPPARAQGLQPTAEGLDDRRIIELLKGPSSCDDIINKLMLITLISIGSGCFAYMATGGRLNAQLPYDCLETHCIQAGIGDIFVCRPAKYCWLNDPNDQALASLYINGGAGIGIIVSVIAAVCCCVLLCRKRK